MKISYPSSVQARIRTYVPYTGDGFGDGFGDGTGNGNGTS